jgi:hypothetical protein
MSRQQAFYQSLATSGAVLITFIGVCHEVVGTRLFPWGLSLFGGAVGWHAVGLSCIAIGLAFLGGALRFIRFPLISALVIAAAGAVVGVFTAVTHHEFHLFAFTLAFAAAGMAFCHRAAVQAPAVSDAG